ncbi:hypothetical protein [Sorangium sp. So ce1182]|uniref:hypothetical protein n=1 Tax=Sorangium sp. So ce1182 TaxID=3133334 RepID=UPI003F619211
MDRGRRGALFWNVGQLAERGEEAGDAARLGEHGDELHPASGTNAKDVPSIWAGPQSAWMDRLVVPHGR